MAELHWVQDIEPHRLALMPRPHGGEWLSREVDDWRDAAVDVVVSLLEAHEVRELELGDQQALCKARGIGFMSFPIPDYGVPASETALLGLVNTLHAHLRDGRSVAIHCRAGIGRTGLVAGCLLHLLRVPGRDIFHVLSRSRGLTMPHTPAQAQWVERFAAQRDNAFFN